MRGWESVWVKMHPQHICKSLAVGYGGGCRGEREGVGVEEKKNLNSATTTTKTSN